MADHPAAASSSDGTPPNRVERPARWPFPAPEPATALTSGPATVREQSREGEAGRGPSDPI
jgi:hypothetical protein